MLRQFFKVTSLCTTLVAVSSIQAADSLYVDPTGNVGVGTSAPTSKLEIQDEDNAAVLVRNTSEVKNERVMFQLQNNGKTRFMIKNREHVWTFNNIGRAFQITKFLSGPPVEFEVWDNGDGYFGGDVYAKQVLLTSSRDSKTDFSPVDHQNILQKLDSLEILSWRYKDDEVSDRHIGPIAEDFQEVFNLGDGTHLSAVDTSGIAFAAIKALIEENNSLKERLNMLEKQQAEVQSVITRLLEQQQTDRLLTSAAMN